ncbi:MAG: beta-lactamase family protein [Pseudomonadales bacterium]|nr:beta-lactamase family protein [Pseudomonadales bacterium]MCP5189932.1 beta-lactamase family protein [Pseudomonadales bacterium]
MNREDKLQQLLARTVDPAPGVLLALHAPLQGLDFAGAAGAACRESGQLLRTDHHFRIASMSKTFTGVLFARLLEQGRISLDDCAADYLPDGVARQIPVVAGHKVEDITLRHLLHHRAGFNDFATSSEWFAEIAADPGRARRPEEIAAWALRHGDLVGAPGERFCYSDTGYVLLGIALETLCTREYWRLCREQIFDPLEMNETWLEGYETPRGELSHPYIVVDGEYIDALQVHGSLDWAAGGHVSRLRDLVRFLRGLSDCRLFDSPETLDAFLTGELARPGYHYAMGINRKRIRGHHLWGHLGHWGSFMYYCPEQRLSLCGTLNYDQAAHNEFIGEVLSTVLPPDRDS